MRRSLICLLALYCALTHTTARVAVESAAAATTAFAGRRSRLFPLPKTFPVKFLVIGDWGRAGNPHYNQTWVARLMAEVADREHPQFVIRSVPVGMRVKRAPENEPISCALSSFQKLWSDHSAVLVTIFTGTV